MQSREKGSYQKMVSCFFLCPDADCSRINLSSPLREEKSFLKGLFLFYGYSQTTRKSRNLIYFNHRGSGGFDMSNSLAAVHPELIAEWSEKNLPLTPDSITFGSNKKVWWKGACGHEWTAVLSSAALISFLYPAID